MGLTSAMGTSISAPVHRAGLPALQANSGVGFDSLHLPRAAVLALLQADSGGFA
jgi:hypothetical protein